MAGTSNLPPGVHESDIPGNRPEDEAYDRAFELLSDTFSGFRLLALAVVLADANADADKAS